MGIERMTGNDRERSYQEVMCAMIRVAEEKLEGRTPAGLCVTAFKLCVIPACEITCNNVPS